MSAGFLDWMYWMTPTAAGAQTQSGLGQQAKAIVWYAIGGANGYSTITDFSTAMGFVDMNGNQMAFATRGLDNVTTTKSYGSLATDRCLVVPTSSGSGTLLEVSFTGWTTDGFNFNVVKTDGNTTIIYFVYSGDDIQWSKVGSFGLPTAANSAFAVTGMGFKPNLVLMGAVNALTVSNHDSAGGQNSFGGMAQSGSNPLSQFCTALNIGNGKTTSTFISSTSTKVDKVIQRITSATSPVFDLDVAGVSLDPDGFTLNVVTAETAGILVPYFALGGPNLQAMIGAFNEPTVTGQWTTPTLPYVPSHTLLASGGQIYSSTVTMYTGASRRSFSGIYNDSYAYMHDAHQTTSGTSFWSLTAQQNLAMEHMKATSATTYNYTAQYSVVSGTWGSNPYFTFNMAYADTASRQTFYIALGNSGLTYTPPTSTSTPWPLFTSGYFMV